MIASRQSRLARVQAEAVGRALSRRHGVDVRYHWVNSAGDAVRDAPLSAYGGKGLFTRAIDQAVLDGKADVAVHSLKDVETTLPPGLRLAATPKRGPVADVLVTTASLSGVQTPADLPVGSSVGTSSPRRAAQLRRMNPSLDVKLLRGNVETRLAAVRGPDATLDATLLAAAGLERLGIADHAGRVQDAEVLLPAVAQGALALVCRGDDHVGLTRCLPLNHAATNTSVTAERELVRLLGADCHSPVATLVEPVDPEQTLAKRNADSHWFRLRAAVYALDGVRVASFDERCKTRDLRRWVKRAAQELRAQGAEELLQQARQTDLFGRPIPPRG